jgi:tRNA (mo5U34)-methyltransferase
MKIDLNSLRADRLKCLNWKNIKPKWEMIKNLPRLDDIEVTLGDTIHIKSNSISKEQKSYIDSVALSLLPWRKGPFNLFNTYIDSEWRSYIKYNIIKEHLDIEGKIVGDIGCNNGYYLFRMLEKNPKKLIGFDPFALYFCQFKFIDHFINSKIKYELLGVEHIEFYDIKFDFLLCLGVLYHRQDPIGALKSLYRGLNSNGTLILDTFMIDGEDEVCLTPKNRYSKIPNIYFIPTVNALKNWCYRAGFSNFEVIDISLTTINEQRKTKWIDTESLNDFLDSTNPTKTIEGYPAPKRVYIKVQKLKKNS